MYFFQILRLQSALEESQLNERQLKHKLEVQTEILNNKMEELQALNEHTQSSMTSEMMEVQMKIMELETIKVRGGRLAAAATSGMKRLSDMHLTLENQRISCCIVNVWKATSGLDPMSENGQPVFQLIPNGNVMLQ